MFFPAPLVPDQDIVIGIGQSASTSLSPDLASDSRIFLREVCIGPGEMSGAALICGFWVPDVSAAFRALDPWDRIPAMPVEWILPAVDFQIGEGERTKPSPSAPGRQKLTGHLGDYSQVAAGLGAIHRQNLVHRDIKPANIVVSLKEGGRLTAKIVDLGLAKPVADAPTEVAISTPGGFAGTPAFASPEQFAGVPVDIRSDLYSLGVTLWDMLTGNSPFRGTPGEVMHQHQHAPLPLERLKISRSQLLFCLSCFWRKTRLGVSRARPNF
jgi:hypothetical protein